MNGVQRRDGAPKGATHKSVLLRDGDSTTNVSKPSAVAAGVLPWSRHERGSICDGRSKDSSPGNPTISRNSASYVVKGDPETHKSHVIYLYIRLFHVP